MAQQAGVGSKNVLVITGVSSGLGLALVNEFISQKWVVYGCARRKKKINELNKKYPINNGNKLAYFSVVDATQEEELKQWCKLVIDEIGSPTIVFANAGVAQERSLVEYTSTNTYHRNMNVNVLHPFLLCREFLPVMKKTNKASAIIGMSSGAGRAGFASFGCYCAAKYALEGLFAAMAQELKDTNVMCATYGPGMIGTEMWADINKLQGKINSVGMPMPDEFAKESYPHLVGLLKNPQENNGKQFETPLWTNEKYKAKVEKAFGAWMKATDDYEKTGNGGQNECETDNKDDIANVFNHWVTGKDPITHEEYYCCCAPMTGYGSAMVGGNVAVVQWVSSSARTVQYRLTGLNSNGKYGLQAYMYGNLSEGIKSCGALFPFDEPFCVFTANEDGNAFGRPPLNSKYNVKTQLWWGRAVAVVEYSDDKETRIVATGLFNFEDIAP